MLNRRAIESEDQQIPEYELQVKMPYWSRHNGTSFGAPYAYFNAPSSGYRNWFTSMWISNPIAEVPQYTDNAGNGNHTGFFDLAQSNLDSSRPDGLACAKSRTQSNNSQMRFDNYAYGGQKAATFDSENPSDTRQWFLGGFSAETTSRSTQQLYLNGNHLGTLTYSDTDALTENPSGYKKAIGTHRYAGAENKPKSFYGKMDGYFLCRRESLTDTGLFSQYGVTGDKNTWQNPFYETDGNIIYLSDERKAAIVEELNAPENASAWTLFIYMRNTGNGEYTPDWAGTLDFTWLQIGNSNNGSYWNLAPSTIPYAYIA